PFLLFQAEDGIRGFHVTGVQTCALPILTPSRFLPQALGLKVGVPTRPVTPVKHRHCLAIAVRMPTGHQTVVSSFSLGVIPGLNPFPQLYCGHLVSLKPSLTWVVINRSAGYQHQTERARVLATLDPSP